MEVITIWLSLAITWVLGRQQLVKTKTSRNSFIVLTIVVAFTAWFLPDKGSWNGYFKWLSQIFGTLTNGVIGK